MPNTKNGSTGGWVGKFFNLMDSYLELISSRRFIENPFGYRIHEAGRKFYLPTDSDMEWDFGNALVNPEPTRICHVTSGIRIWMGETGKIKNGHLFYPE